MTNEPRFTQQEKIDRLDESNTARLQDLLNGRSGLPVQFPPGTFEIMRLIVFMEALLERFDALPEAKLLFGEKLSEELGRIETESRQAKITAGIHGNGPQPPPPGGHIQTPRMQ